jgi:hypothetical protein
MFDKKKINETLDSVYENITDALSEGFSFIENLVDKLPEPTPGGVGSDNGVSPEVITQMRADLAKNCIETTKGTHLEAFGQMAADGWLNPKPALPDEVVVEVWSSLPDEFKTAVKGENLEKDVVVDISKWLKDYREKNGL